MVFDLILQGFKLTGLWLSRMLQVVDHHVKEYFIGLDLVP